MSETDQTGVVVLIGIELVAAKRHADSAKASVASQGQAMSGLEELATYRDLIAKLDRCMGGKR